MSRSLLLVTLSALTTTAAWAQDAESDDSNIPTDTAIGIGIGISAPTGSFAPNTASARFRIADGIALEPSVRFGVDNSRQVTESPDDENVQATRSQNVRAQLGGRFRLAQRDDVELMGLGGASFGVASTTTDPEGSDNNSTTTTTTVALNWGIGVNWWAHRSFCLSADVQNPLFSVSSTRASAENSETTTTSTGTSAGIVFSPTARMMGHVTF